MMELFSHCSSQEWPSLRHFTFYVEGLLVWFSFFFCSIFHFPLHYVYRNTSYFNPLISSAF